MQFKILKSDAIGGVVIILKTLREFQMQIIFNFLIICSVLGQNIVQGNN